MKTVIDPNESFKRKLYLYLTVIIVTIPFFFIYIKYQSIETKQKNVAKINEVSIKKDVNIIKLLLNKNDNYLEINFHVIRKMKLSNDKKRLYLIGHDRRGIAILNIENTENIKLLSIYNFPNIKENYVENIDLVETKDGLKLYVVSPNLGLYCFDISNPQKVKLEKIVNIKNALKISLSNDEKKAYIRSDRGMYIIDLSSKEPIVLGEYISTNSIGSPQLNNKVTYPIDTGDIAMISDKNVFLLDRKGLHLLDVSNPKQIKAVTHIATMGRGREIIIAPNKLRVYIRSISNNLEFYDISDLYNIRSFGSYTSTKEYIGGVKITEDGTKIILASKYYGKQRLASIEIVDVSYSLDPKMIKKYEVYTYGKNITFDISSNEKNMFISFRHDDKYNDTNYILVKKISLEK